MHFYMLFENKCVLAVCTQPPYNDKKSTQCFFIFITPFSNQAILSLLSVWRHTRKNRYRQVRLPKNVKSESAKKIAIGASVIYIWSLWWLIRTKCKATMLKNGIAFVIAINYYACSRSSQINKTVRILSCKILWCWLSDAWAAVF